MWNSSIGKANDKRRTCHNTHEYKQENITTYLPLRRELIDPIYGVQQTKVTSMATRDDIKLQQRRWSRDIIKILFIPSTKLLSLGTSEHASYTQQNEEMNEKTSRTEPTIRNATQLATEMKIGSDFSKLKEKRTRQMLRRTLTATLALTSTATAALLLAASLS